MNKQLNTVSQKNINLFYYVYIFVYTIFNLFTLSVFPRVHSDEIWIGSLSNVMLNTKSLFTTEPFFDLFPRTPHTMKILFHTLQMIPIKLLSLSVTNIRLVSLFFGILTLLFLYRILIIISQNQLLSLLVTILTSMSIPFLYASHFARQEIVLVFVLTFVYYLYIQQLKTNVFLIPIILGISISLHPNAFIIACMIGLVLLKDTIIHIKKRSTLICYVIILALFASMNVFVSLLQNPHFIRDYLAYGKTLSVTAAPVSRLSNFKDFYIKSYEQITGTYYIPPMKIFIAGTFILLVLGFIMIIIKLSLSKKQHMLKSSTASSFSSDKMLTNPITSSFTFNHMLMIIAFNIGLFIIGRYNTTSIVFMYIPSMLLLTSLGIDIQKLFPNKKSTYSILALCGLILLFSYESLTEFNDSKFYDYSRYEKEISSVLTEDSIILGNLSSGFVFSDYTFFDIRNLEYLNGESVYDYLSRHSINTIVYYEEYDYIHRNQNWEILYGDDSPYYKELNTIIKDYGTVLHDFEDMYYGTRIMRYMGEYPWKVIIYHLDFQK